MTNEEVKKLIGENGSQSAAVLMNLLGRIEVLEAGGGGSTDISGKADKVSGATNGNFAGLDANGNLTDSGSKAGDFATATQGAKADTAYQKPQTGIPESDLSSDVQQALQKHFKGWYDSYSNLPANPVVGDYAYVKGAETTDPAAIYECTTNGSWSDSGRTADTSNVQTFADGQEVNEVHIVNDFTGGVDDVASAETVKTLNENKIDKIEQDVNYTSVTRSSYTTGYIKSTGITSSTVSNVSFFPVTQGKTYKISGKYHGMQTSYLYAYYNGDTFVEAGGVSSTEDKGQVKEMEVTVPIEGTITHIVVETYVTTVVYVPTCDEKVVTQVNNQGIIHSVGDVSDLQTTNKNTLVEAINEVIGDVSGISEDVSEIADNISESNTKYLLSPTPRRNETSFKSSIEWTTSKKIDADGIVQDTASNVYEVSQLIAIPQGTTHIHYVGAVDVSASYKHIAIYNSSEQCIATYLSVIEKSGLQDYEVDITQLEDASYVRVAINTSRYNSSAFGFVNYSIVYNSVMYAKFNQWKGKKALVLGASTIGMGVSNGTSVMQIAANILDMSEPLMYTSTGNANDGGLGARRVSLKYNNDNEIIEGGISITENDIDNNLAEGYSYAKSRSWERIFANDFDLVVFGGFAGESWGESEVVEEGVTYYGGTELINKIILPSERYDNNPHITYSSGIGTLESHRNSYIGAVIYLLDKLWTLKPTCKVVFMFLYLNYANYNSQSRNREGIAMLCERLHIPFIDISKYVYFNGYTTGNGREDEYNDDVYLFDGEHPSLAGRQRMGSMLAHRLLLYA